MKPRAVASSRRIGHRHQQAWKSMALEWPQDFEAQCADCGETDIRKLCCYRIAETRPALAQSEVYFVTLCERCLGEVSTDKAAERGYSVTRIVPSGEKPPAEPGPQRLRVLVITIAVVIGIIIVALFGR
jgi:hypothetical protein